MWQMIWQCVIRECAPFMIMICCLCYIQSNNDISTCAVSWSRWSCVPVIQQNLSWYRTKIMHKMVDLEDGMKLDWGNAYQCCPSTANLSERARCCWTRQHCSASDLQWRSESEEIWLFESTFSVALSSKFLRMAEACWSAKSGSCCEVAECKAVVRHLGGWKVGARSGSPVASLQLRWQ